MEDYEFGRKSRNISLMLLPIKRKDFEDDENDAHKFKDPDKGASVNDVENVTVRPPILLKKKYTSKGQF